MALTQRRLEYKRKWRAENPDKVKQYRATRKEKHDQWRKENKEHIKEYRKIYIEKNKDAIRENAKEYWGNNPDKMKAKNARGWKKHKAKRTLKNYQRKKVRLKTDPFFKLRETMRNRLRTHLRSKGLKKHQSSLKYFGAEWEVIRKHIENQFEDWMTWDNHGMHTWHIDHIIPVSKATTEEELMRLFHYTNLQPLKAENNWSKNDKFKEEDGEIT